MKNLKNFNQFVVSEALKDDIPFYMQNAIHKNNSKNSNDILNMDVPEHNKLIDNINDLFQYQKYHWFPNLSY